MPLLVGRDDIAAFSGNGYGGFGGGNASTITHTAIADGDADTLEVNINSFSNNTVVQVVIYEQVAGAGDFNAVAAVDVPAGAGPQSVSLGTPIPIVAGNVYRTLFSGDVSSLDANTEEQVIIAMDPTVVSPDGSGSVSAEYPTYPATLNSVGREVDGEHYWNLSGPLAASITGVTGAVAPGEQIVVSTQTLGAITSATLNGVDLTINSTAANQATLTIPDALTLDVDWGEAYDLVVGDGVDTATSSQVVSAPSGWDYVNLTAVPNYNDTDSFAELGENTSAFTNYTAAIGQQIQYTTHADLSVTNESVTNVFPTQTVTGTFRIRYLDDVDGVTPRYIESAYTIGELDDTPIIPAFNNVTDAAVSTVFTSNTVTPTDFNTPLPISITGGEYSRNGGAFTANAGTLNPGDTLQLRATSSAQNDTAISAVVTINGVSQSFSITTEILPDTTPDAFSFTAVTNATLLTRYTSDAITVAGINLPAAISITGVGAEYSIDDGAWTDQAGTVTVGQQVRVRGTSAATLSGELTATLTIGGVTGDFVITTDSSAPDGSTNEPIYADIFAYPAFEDGKRRVLYRNNTNQIVFENAVNSVTNTPVTLSSVRVWLTEIANQNNIIFGPVNVANLSAVTIPFNLNLDAYTEAMLIVDLDSTAGSQAYLEIPHTIEDRDE